jgi:hypothetical protein
LTVRAPTAGLQPIAWRTVGQALQLRALRAKIAQQTGETASKLRVGATGNPQSSLLTVYADAKTDAEARLVANSAASVAVNFLLQSVGGATVTRSTFEHSSESWDVGTGIYVLPANRIGPTAAVTHSGAGSLEVDCVTLVTGGCGPYIRLEKEFRKGRAYSAVGWLKAQPGKRIRLVLGSTPQDVAVGATATGDSRWKRLSVTWVPQRSADLAVAAFQVMSVGPSHFYIDDVDVGPQSAIAHETAPAGGVTRYETILPAETSRALGSGHTAEWAAGGAAAGLLIGAAAAAAATAASRKRARRLAAEQETLF